MVILVPVDGKQEPEPAVSVGADLADAYDDQLAVLHVLPRDEFESRRDQRSKEYNLDLATNDAARVAREVVEATLSEDVPREEIGRVGEPAEEILEEAERRDVRYLVIRSQKRTAVGKAVFGSTTQSVLLNIEQPVVTVPTGFDSEE